MTFRKSTLEALRTLRRASVEYVREILGIYPDGYPVGLELRDMPLGTPVSMVPPGGAAYLVAVLDCNFKAGELTLAGNLRSLRVTSWTSNGIRDQNLLAEHGVPAEAFSAKSRRMVIDAAPTLARQAIVIEVTNDNPKVGARVRGFLLGTPVE